MCGHLNGNPSFFGEAFLLSAGEVESHDLNKSVGDRWGVSVPLSEECLLLGWAGGCGANPPVECMPLTVSRRAYREGAYCIQHGQGT